MSVLYQVKFWIFDFGFSIEKTQRHPSSMFFNPKSKIENPK